MWTKKVTCGLQLNCAQIYLWLSSQVKFITELRSASEVAYIIGHKFRSPVNVICDLWFVACFFSSTLEYTCEKYKASFLEPKPGKPAMFHIQFCWQLPHRSWHNNARPLSLSSFFPQKFKSVWKQRKEIEYLSKRLFLHNIKSSFIERFKIVFL